MITSFAGPNAAPLEPLIKLRDNPTEQPSNYLCDAIREKFEHHVKHYNLERREILASAQELALFIQGQHNLMFNPYTGQWRTRQPKRMTTDTRRGLNTLQRYVTEFIAKWQSSNPDIVVKATTQDESIFGGVKAINLLNDKYEEKFYKAQFGEHEALHSFVFGTYIEQVRHDPKAAGNVLYRQIFEDRTIPIDDGYGACGQCDYQGIAGDFQHPDPEIGEACPQCKSPLVFTQPPKTETLSMPVAQEPVNFGDFNIRLLPLPSCYWDFEQTPEESSYFIYRQNVAMGQIRALLGNVKIPGQPDYDFSQQVIEAMVHSGSPVSGVGTAGAHGSAGSLWKDKVTIEEMWLLPEDYNDIIPKKDELAIDGTVIPAGKPLSETYPDGMCITGLNGMKLLLGIYKERHSNYISSGSLHSKVLSGVGRNAADVIEPIKRFNKFDAQFLTTMDAQGSPGGGYAKDAIDAGDAKFLGKPGYYVPIDTALTGGDIKGAVQQFTPANVSGQMIEYVQQFLQAQLQSTSHIVQLNSGQANVDINTAHGQELANANANAILGPLLKKKAACRIQTAKNTMRLIKQHLPPQLIAQMLGKNGEMLVDAFMKVDMDADISWSIVQDSEIPRDTFTKRQEISTFVNLFGGPEGLRQSMDDFPELVSETAKSFNIQIESVDQDDVAQRCEIRLRSMMDAMQGGAMDAQSIALAMQPPVSLAEPAIEMKLKWFRDWLDTDEAWKPENMTLRGAVDLICQAHFQVIGATSAAVARQRGAAAGQAGAAQDEQAAQAARDGSMKAKEAAAQQNGLPGRPNSAGQPGA